MNMDFFFLHKEIKEFIYLLLERYRALQFAVIFLGNE